MVYPTDAATDAAIGAGRIKSADLVDFYLADASDDPLTLRCWTWNSTCSYAGTVALDGSTAANTYESMHRRIVIHKQIRMAATLSSEPLRMQLDASRSGDDEDFVGRFVDAKYHQRRIRIRQVAMDWSTHALASLPMWEWHGLLDHRELIQEKGKPQFWDVTCQGGLFRVRGRRLRTRSHTDQQLRDAGDQFYVGTAAMVGRPLNWSKKPANIPGSATAAAAPGKYAGSGILTDALVNSINSKYR